MMTMAIYEMDNGKYQVRIDYRDGVKYRRKTKVFSRKTEARNWQDKMRVELKTGANFSDADITFADFFDRWIAIYKTDTVKPHTHDMYQLTAKHLRHFFPNQKLTDIRKEDYQRFLNEFGRNHGIATSRKTNQQIRSAVQDALAENIIQRDFTFRVKITGADPKEADTKFLDIDEYHTLRQYLIDQADVDHMSSCMLLFQLETGTRFEEAAGMTWDHLDLDNGIVTIDRQWDPKTKDFAKTKGNGQADGKITIPPEYCDWLKNFHQQMINFYDEQDLSYKKINPKGLTFFSKYRTIISNDGANRALSRICAKLQIKQVTTHAMRHTHASVLILNKMSLPYVQHRLRHKKLQTTMNNYIHLIEKVNGESDQKLMKLLGDGFKKWANAPISFTIRTLNGHFKYV